MKKLKLTTVILSSIILISCATRSTDKAVTDVSNIQKEKTLSDSTFDDFLKKFSKDTTFQLLRIKFPLAYYYISENEETDDMLIKHIQKSEWKIIDLIDTKEFNEPVEIEIEPKGSNLIELLVKGIDTGLSITYCFKKEDNKWYLIKIIDQSN